MKIAPADDTYHFSLEWREQNPNSKFLGYDRGQMCMKHIAWRLGADADWCLASTGDSPQFDPDPASG